MKKFTLLVLSLSLCLSTLAVPASASSASFTDVPAGSWYCDAVMSCAEKGYVSGVGNNQFMPEGKLTYAQVFTMLTNAFFKDEKQDYEANRHLEMDAYFDGNPQWWSYNAFYFNENGFLKGVDVNIKSAASANAPITRYDVVQIADNILTSKGITASEAQKTQARNTISDWSSVPAGYQDAVAFCFSLGIVSGYEGNRFVGTDTLTRAQACVILNALEQVVLAGPQTSTGTSTDGVLANGKPITEENVLELLAEIEKEYPTGTVWTDLGEDPNTKYNPNKVSDTMNQTILRKYNVDTKYACGGFAAMVSDLVFGYNNPCRQVNDLADIRPGDIIVKMNGRTVKHVMVAASTPINSNNVIRVAEGNVNDQVVWPTADDPNLSLPGNGNTTWVVYTRYPA